MTEDQGPEVEYEESDADISLADKSILLKPFDWLCPVHGVTRNTTTFTFSLDDGSMASQTVCNACLSDFLAQNFHSLERVKEDG